MSTGTLERRRSASSRPQSFIDPRLEARRDEVSRDRQRRRFRRVAVGALILVSLGGAYGLTRTAALDVDDVLVEGAAGRARADVVQAADVERGTPLLDVDVAAVETRVSALAWVDTVVVQRRWPGTVSVVVDARIPVAVDTAGVAADGSGRVLGAAVPGTTSDLPLIGVQFGPPGTQLDRRQRLVLEVLAAIPSSLAEEVESGQLGRSDVWLTLRDGITVRVGDSSRIRAKFVAIEALLEQADRSTIAALDVRVPSSPSVTPKPGTERAEAASLTDLDPGGA